MRYIKSPGRFNKKCAIFLCKLPIAFLFMVRYTVFVAGNRIAEMEDKKMRIYDFDKVQKDYLNAALKASKNGTSNMWIFAHCEDEKVTIISDSYFMAMIPDDLVFVQTHKIFSDSSALLRNIAPDYTLSPAIDTGMKKTIDKNTVCIFRVNDIDVWVNEKYVKYFAGMNCEFRGSTKKAPLQIYVNDKCIGLILPINHND